MRKPLAVLSCVALAVTLCVGTSATAASATTKVPDQFIAKMYTEVLGRAPDPAGWTFQRDGFQTTGCTAVTLSDRISEFFASSEFTALGYDDAEKILVAYRAVLNREADQVGFDDHLAQLVGGTPLSSIVADLTASPEFASLAGRICDTSSAGYGFDDSGVPVTLPDSGSGFRGTQAQLQTLLNSAAPGATIAVARHTVVRLSQTLYVPDGVTLTTAGSSSRAAYAAMARLTREPGWTGPSIVLGGSSRLQRIWASGSRGRESGWDRDRATVFMSGGDGTAVVSSRLSEPSGASSLRSAGSGDGMPCYDNLVEDNLVTSYTSEFTTVRQSDGLSIGCEDTLVQNNAVIDATDVAIVVFPVSASVPQVSQVTGNTVIHAGLSAQGSIAVDALFDTTGDSPGVASRSFAGGSVDHNTIWMGDSVTAQIALSVGGRPWYGANGRTFSGGSVTANTSAGLPVRAASTIAVSGALGTIVTGNTLTSVLVPSASPCPSRALGASVAAGYASGTLPGYSDALYLGCVSFP